MYGIVIFFDVRVCWNLAMRSSSFYVNCDAFSAAADASRRGVDTFLDDETFCPQKNACVNTNWLRRNEISVSVLFKKIG